MLADGFCVGGLLSLPAAKHSQQVTVVTSAVTRNDEDEEVSGLHLIDVTRPGFAAAPCHQVESQLRGSHHSGMNKNPGLP